MCPHNAVHLARAKKNFIVDQSNSSFLVHKMDLRRITTGHSDVSGNSGRSHLQNNNFTNNADDDFDSFSANPLRRQQSSHSSLSSLTGDTPLNPQLSKRSVDRLEAASLAQPEVFADTIVQHLGLSADQSADLYQFATVLP